MQRAVTYVLIALGVNFYLDAYLTYLLVDNIFYLENGMAVGIREGNPLMAWLMEHIGDWWLLIKILAGVASIGCFWWIKRIRPKLVLWTVFSLAAFYLAVNVRHIWAIYKLSNGYF